MSTQNRIEEILSLTSQGYRVTKLSDWHYRINNLVDLYPVKCKFHIIAGLEKNVRGSWVGMKVKDVVDKIMMQGRKY